MISNVYGSSNGYVPIPILSCLRNMDFGPKYSALDGYLTSYMR